MNAFLEDDVEELVEADEWAGMVADTRERQRRELAKKMAEFEASGGKVYECRHGETAANDGSGPYFSFPAGARATPDVALREASAKARLERVQRKAADDSHAAQRIGRLLGTVKSSYALCKALGCSNERVQRLLRRYFSKDPRAALLLAGYNEGRPDDYEETLVRKIRAVVAMGLTGIHNVAEYCGESYQIIKSMEKKYELVIPRAGGKLTRWQLKIMEGKVHGQS